MALDHHDMDKDMERVLKTGNYVSFNRFVKYIRKIFTDIELEKIACWKAFVNFAVQKVYKYFDAKHL